MALRYIPFNFTFQTGFGELSYFFSPLFSNHLICFARMLALQPQHKRHTVSPTFLFNQLHVIFFKSSVCLFQQSCILRIVSRWLILLHAYTMRRLANIWNSSDAAPPLRQEPPLLSCEGRLSTPCHCSQGPHSRTTVLREHTPMPSASLSPQGEKGCFLSRKATKHLILDFSHMRLISDWLFSRLGKSHGYLQEPKLPISTLGRFTQSLGKR